MVTLEPTLVASATFIKPLKIESEPLLHAILFLFFYIEYYFYKLYIDNMKEIYSYQRLYV